MNFKKFFLIMGVVLILFGIGIFWYLSSKQNRTVVTPGSSTPVSQESIYTPKDTGRVEVRSKTGQSVRVVDPRTNGTQVSTEYNDVLMIESKDFQIQYFPEDDRFGITLLNHDIWSARTAAEKAFVERLGISKSDACSLKVNLGIPIGVNSEFPGVDFGLSFCPRSLLLPEQGSIPTTGTGSQE